MNLNFLTIIVNYIKYFFLRLFFINNIKNTIGVTGTNGKTTTTFLIRQIYNDHINSDINNNYCGLIGGEIIDDGKLIIKSKLTTPGILDIYKIFTQMNINRLDSVVMEVSSQGYHQGRLLLLNYDVGIFTNITNDHLDYHHNFENYLNTKIHFLQSVNKLLIINYDDKHINYILDKLSNKNIKTFGLNPKSDVIISDIVSDINGSTFNISYTKKLISRKITYSINLIGLFNVYNFVGSLTYFIYNDYNIDLIPCSLTLKAPPGRLEKIKNNIYIDFAHTPDAINNIITTIKSLKNINKIIVVTGAGGNRSKEKRPLMGKELEFVDYVILTSDNPRNENPLDIINDIIGNNKFNNLEVIVDRTEAIKKGIQLLKNNDVLLVLGKGNERYMEINNIKIDYYDGDVINKYYDELIY